MEIHREQEEDDGRQPPANDQGEEMQEEPIKEFVARRIAQAFIKQELGDPTITDAQTHTIHHPILSRNDATDLLHKDLPLKACSPEHWQNPTYGFYFVLQLEHFVSGNTEGSYDTSCDARVVLLDIHERVVVTTTISGLHRFFQLHQLQRLLGESGHDMIRSALRQVRKKHNIEFLPQDDDEKRDLHNYASDQQNVYGHTILLDHDTEDIFGERILGRGDFASNAEGRATVSVCTTNWLGPGTLHSFRYDLERSGVRSTGLLDTREFQTSVYYGLHAGACVLADRNDVLSGHIHAHKVVTTSRRVLGDGWLPPWKIGVMACFGQPGFANDTYTNLSSACFYVPQQATVARERVQHHKVDQQPAKSRPHILALGVDILYVRGGIHTGRLPQYYNQLRKSDLISTEKRRAPPQENGFRPWPIVCSVDEALLVLRQGASSRRERTSVQLLEENDFPIYEYAREAPGQKNGNVDLEKIARVAYANISRGAGHAAFSLSIADALGCCWMNCMRMEGYGARFSVAIARACVNQAIFFADGDWSMSAKSPKIKGGTIRSVPPGTIRGNLQQVDIESCYPKLAIAHNISPDDFYVAVPHTVSETPSFFESTSVRVPGSVWQGDAGLGTDNPHDTIDVDDEHEQLPVPREVGDALPDEPDDEANLAAITIGEAYQPQPVPVGTDQTIVQLTGLTLGELNQQRALWPRLDQPLSPLAAVWSELLARRKSYKVLVAHLEAVLRTYETSIQKATSVLSDSGTLQNKLQHRLGLVLSGNLSPEYQADWPYTEQEWNATYGQLNDANKLVTQIERLAAVLEKATESLDMNTELLEQQKRRLIHPRSSEQVFKLLANRLFGLLAHRSFRFRSPAALAMITRLGRDAIDSLQRTVVQNGGTVLAVRTDSILYRQPTSGNDIFIRLSQTAEAMRLVLKHEGYSRCVWIAHVNCFALSLYRNESYTGQPDVRIKGLWGQQSEAPAYIYRWIQKHVPGLMIDDVNKIHMQTFNLIFMMDALIAARARATVFDMSGQIVAYATSSSSARRRLYKQTLALSLGPPAFHATLTAISLSTDVGDPAYTTPYQSLVRETPWRSLLLSGMRKHEVKLLQSLAQLFPSAASQLSQWHESERDLLRNKTFLNDCPAGTEDALLLAQLDIQNSTGWADDPYLENMTAPDLLSRPERLVLQMRAFQIVRCTGCDRLNYRIWGATPSECGLPAETWNRCYACRQHLSVNRVPTISSMAHGKGVEFYLQAAFSNGDLIRQSLEAYERATRSNGVTYAEEIATLLVLTTRAADFIPEVMRGRGKKLADGTIQITKGPQTVLSCRDIRLLSDERPVAPTGDPTHGGRPR